MRALPLFAIFFATPAFAHAGHLADLAGHSHWLGLGALLGAAAVAGLLGAKSPGKGRKETETADDEPETDAEEQPA